jgi:hypothetical protein
LQLIPLFGQVWQFIVVTWMAGSIRNEMASWHNDSFFGADAVLAESGNRRPTFGIGITYCALNTGLIVFNLFNSAHSDSLYTLIALLGLIQIACWIIYWVQLSLIKNKLKRGQALVAA